MKVLILGAKGSLGQTFVDLYHDQEVFAWDREELDITNEEMVAQKISELRPDLIVNCAAYNAVDKAEEEMDLANQINGYSVGFLSKAADSTGAIMVHFSSNYSFDGTDKEGYNEDAPVSPQSAYAKSKVLGEMELAENSEKFYLIRTAWLYGRDSLTGKPSFVDTMLKLAEKNQEIKSINDEFGQPTFVVDLAHATRAIVEEKKPFGIYHITNSGSSSWYEWAREIFEIRKMQVALTPISRDEYPRKAPRPQYGILNNTKFIELRPWTEALKEYLS